VARRIVRDLAARTASPARESRRIARPEERGIGVMTTYGYEAPYGQEIGEAEWAAGQFGEFDAGEYADQFDADCKARVNRRVVSQAVVIATGVAADGHREVLGFRRRLRGRRLLDRVPALAQGPRCDQHPARRL
jgi:hypothetical protein